MNDQTHKTESAPRQAPPLKPIYAIISEQPYLREQAVTRLRARIEQEGDLDFNFDQFDAAQAHIDDVLASANTLPFASPYRLVIVENIDALKADALAPLVEYAKAPSETTVLALVGAKLAKSSRLYKAVNELGGILERKPPTKKELPAVVQGLLAERGRKAETPAVHALINAVGEDLTSLSQAIEKLVAYAGDRALIAQDDISAVVGMSAEVKVWEFTNALGDRDGARALSLLSRSTEQGNSIFAAQALAVRAVRELLLARSLMQRGASSSEIAQELGKPDWLAGRVVAQAKNYSVDELRNSLVAMASVEHTMKSSAFAEVAFERWVLETCSRG